jgi:hypothetical protein
MENVMTLSMRTVAGPLILIVFSALSLASSNSKTAETKQSSSAATTANTPPGADPSKSATLLGSCDFSDTWRKECTEAYAPSKLGDEKKACSDKGSGFRSAPCPRLKAVTQCFNDGSGFAPPLTATYKYEGADPSTADGCARGFRDYRKDPEVKVGGGPASCNAVATGAVCMQFSAVSEDAEWECRNAGGRLKQPAEACPTGNGLDAYKASLKDGTVATAYFYTTPYTNQDGTFTKTADDVAVSCRLSGASCQKVSFGNATASAAHGASGVAAKRAAKPEKKR